MKSIDYVIVGLGNPGEKYRETRHNFGRRFSETLRALGDGVSTLRTWRGHQIAEQSFGETKTLFFFPETFMNVSGDPIQEFLAYRNFTPDQLIVCHDELDLPLGRIQVRRDGSSGGHNGVASIIERLGTQDFWRVRLGIGRPTEEARNPKSEIRNEDAVTDYVLGTFAPDQKEMTSKVIDEGARLLVELLKTRLESTSRTFEEENRGV